MSTTDKDDIEDDGWPPWEPRLETDMEPTANNDADRLGWAE